MWNLFKVNNKNFEHISQLGFSVSIPDPEQVCEYDVNSRPVTNLGGRCVKIFNSLNPLKCFTENCKTYRNLGKPVSISEITPVRFSSCQIH